MIDENLVAARLDAVDEEPAEGIGDGEPVRPVELDRGADQRLAVNAVDGDALQIRGRHRTGLVGGSRRLRWRPGPGGGAAGFDVVGTGALGCCGVILGRDVGPWAASGCANSSAPSAVAMSVVGLIV